MNEISSPPKARDKTRMKWMPFLYRQARLWHGYLSAWAFIMLVFFSSTGLMLNHPEWFVESVLTEKEVELQLPKEVLNSLATADNSERRLANLVSKEIPLLGVYKDGFTEDQQIQTRMTGVKGISEINADLNSGKVEVRILRSSSVTILNELHRGMISGSAWRVLIDIAGVTILLLSFLGYILFFTVKKRLKMNLLFTGFSLVLLIIIFAVFVQ